MFAAHKSAAANKPLPEFIAQTTANTGNATISIERPSGVSTGDLLVFVLYVGANGTVTSAPSGWSAAINSGATIGAMAVYTKVATSSEPTSYSFTHSSSNSKTGSILAYRNANAINATGTPNYTSSSLTATATSISPTKAGTLIAAFGYENNRTVATPPSGMTARATFSSNGPAFYVYDQGSVGSGSTGNKVAVFSGPGTFDNGGVLFQIVNQ